MLRKTVLIAVVGILFVLPSLAIAAGPAGTTGTVFNRKFVQKLKPLMTQDEMTRMVGNAGQKVKEEKTPSGARSMYRWNGGRNSALDVTVAGGRIVEVTVTTPKKKKYTLGKKGELVEL